MKVLFKRYLDAMKQLSLDNLRTFVTVVDLCGFAKAGEKLGRSQPAVSLQIKRLEQQYEDLMEHLQQEAVFALKNVIKKLLIMYLINQKITNDK